MDKRIKHKPYYAIDAYEILAKKSEKDCAKKLGITLRTYQNKKKGYSDFSMVEAEVLSKFLMQPADSLFLV